MPGPGVEICVQELADGLGADAVFDTVGGSSPLKSGLSLCRSGGTVVLFAHAPADMQADFDLNAFFKHEQRVIGTYSGALSEQARVFELICQGALDPSPLVTHRFSLDEFQTGIGAVVRKKALKVLFTPSEAAGAGAQ